MKKRTPAGTLKIYRQMKNWSQQELGEKVGVPRSRICDFEKSRRSISKDMAKKFAKIFGTSAVLFI